MRRLTVGQDASCPTLQEPTGSERARYVYDYLPSPWSRGGSGEPGNVVELYSAEKLNYPVMKVRAYRYENLNNVYIETRSKESGSTVNVNSGSTTIKLSDMGLPSPSKYAYWIDTERTSAPFSVVSPNVSQQLFGVGSAQLHVNSGFSFYLGIGKKWVLNNNVWERSSDTSWYFFISKTASSSYMSISSNYTATFVYPFDE